MAYLKGAHSRRTTPQNEVIPGKSQVANSAGGHVFPVDNFTRVERFLILGSEGGSYYANERKLTRDNLGAVEAAIAEDGKRVIEMVVDVSDNGRAPSNDPALFVLAMCASCDDLSTRTAALDALPKVARIGTHLFHFVDFANDMRGWSKGFKRAIQRWYVDRKPHSLALQLVKYAQRDGWSHRDVLRLAKPRGRDLPADINACFKYATTGVATDAAPSLIQVVSQIADMSKRDLVAAITEHNLPMEVIPTDRRDPEVYEALIPNAGMTWLFRNLGNLGKHGLLSPMSGNTAVVCARLTDEDAVRKSRVHPLQALIALNTYKSGRGMKGSGAWDVNGDVVDALDNAFYLAFDNVEPSGARTLLALDVSGSMASPVLNGMPGITPRVGSAAMAMVTHRTEPVSHIVAFSDGKPLGGVTGASMWRGGGGKSGLVPLTLSRQMSLDQVVREVSGLPFGGTDCALPMRAALAAEMEVDTFIIYTDSETWHGDIHPCQALDEYRRKTGIPAKLVVVGMVSNAFSLADPSDGGMLDVVGFDTAAPAVIADFSRPSAGDE